MGSTFPSCFPRRRWGSRDSQLGQPATPDGDSPDGPDGEVRAAWAPSTSSISSPEGDPQDGRAYFSKKARVSFRHQFDLERDSTN